MGVSVDDNVVGWRHDRWVSHTGKGGAIVKYVFDDAAFAREALRVARFAGEGGADLAEVRATTARIPDGDEAAWTAAWCATAARTARLGEESMAAGDPVSARGAFLRASNYYRAADLSHRVGSSSDSPVPNPSTGARDYFLRAAELLDTSLRGVRIPYGDGELPGYLFLVDDSGEPRPTVIYTNGFDAAKEEGYFVIGAAALRRGYNFLAYDGPGQGSMVRERGIPFRPDWENVLGPVVDYALAVPEIDGDQLVHFGYGLGAYLVARYAVHDHRSAAVICHDGMTTFYASCPQIPESVLGLIEEGYDDEAIPMLDVLMKEDAGVRSLLRNGQRVFGVDTAPEYVRKTTDYTLTARDVGRIATPVLVLEGEDDTALAGQASNFAHAMTAPVAHVVLRRVAGAGRHHFAGAASLLHQTVFDFLARTLRQGWGRSAGVMPGGPRI